MLSVNLLVYIVEFDLLVADSVKFLDVFHVVVGPGKLAAEEERDRRFYKEKCAQYDYNARHYDQVEHVVFVVVGNLPEIDCLNEYGKRVASCVEHRNE